MGKILFQILTFGAPILSLWPISLNNQQNSSPKQFNVRIISRTLDSTKEIDKIYQTESQNSSITDILKQDPETFKLSAPFKLSDNPLKYGQMVEKIGQVKPQWNDGKGSWWGISLPTIYGDMTYNSFSLDKWDLNEQEVPFYEWKSPVGIDDFVITKNIVIIFAQVKATDHRWQDPLTNNMMFNQSLQTNSYQVY